MGSTFIGRLGVVVVMIVIYYWFDNIFEWFSFMPALVGGLTYMALMPRGNRAEVHKSSKESPDG